MERPTGETGRLPFAQRKKETRVGEGLDVENIEDWIRHVICKVPITILL